MHPLLFLMRSLFHIIPLIASVALCVSCGSSIDPDEIEPLPGTYDPVPEPEQTESRMSLNGQEFQIKSVGYYHDAEKKGFDIVFSEDVIDFSQIITSTPSSFTFVLDVPETAFGFTKELPYVIEGDKWSFYYSYAINGVDASVEESPMIIASSIKSGSMNIKLKDGELTLNFSSVDNNGDKLECVYQGKPYKSDYYLWWN